MELSQMRGVDPVVEDYLDRLTAPLVGVVPYEARSALRAETQEHLEIRVEQLLRDGMAYPEATVEAIRRYGSAKTASEEFLSHWFESSNTSPLLRKLGKANGIAFSWFLIAHLGYAVFLQIYVFDPSGAAYSLPISPGGLRRFVPEPLPQPDAPWALMAIYGYPVLAPIIAGILAGIKIPVRAHHAVWNAMLPIVVYSFVQGTLLLPVRTGILFALFQAVYWIPVGAAVALAASSIRRTREAS